MAVGLVRKLSLSWLIFLLNPACGGPTETVLVESKQPQDCQVDPNAQLFQKAVCICEDLSDIGNGITTKSLAAFLGLADSDHTSHVGVNGHIGSIGNLHVDGILDVGENLGNIGNVRVKNDLFVGQGLTNAGNIQIDGDTFVGGSLGGVGRLSIKGALSVTGSIFYLGLLAYETLFENAAFPTHDPCACDLDEVLDVGALVAAQRGAAQVNLPSGIGHTDIRLNSGDYYADDDSLFIGNSFFRVEGAVRLFVEADINLIGNRIIYLAEGATLDMYISGSVRTIGNFLGGLPENHAAAHSVRIYIGGDSDVSLDVVGNEVFWGGIYAPMADVHFIGNMIVKGALFARNVRGIGNLMVVYDEEIGDVCPEDGSEDPPQDPDEPPV